MSGTPKFSINHKIVVGSRRADVYFSIFIALYNFFSAQGVRVAYNIGANGGALAYTPMVGTPFLDYGNCWAVFQMTTSTSTYYVLIQHSFNATLGTSPGNPGALHGSTNMKGVGISIALTKDGTSPWNGTTNNNGTDTKGASVWKVGSNTLIFPRSNNSGGNFAAHTEDMMSVIDNNILSTGSSAIEGQGAYLLGVNLHIIKDKENLLIYTEVDNQGFNYFMYFGQYDPFPGQESPGINVVCLSSMDSSLTPGIDTLASGISNIYGSLLGNTSYEGGAYSTKLGSIVGCVVELPTQIITATNPYLIPNNESRFTEFSVTVVGYESGAFDFLGAMNSFLKVIHNVPPYCVFKDDKLNPRIALARTYSEGNRITVPWPSFGIAPLSGKREGVQL